MTVREKADRLLREKRVHYQGTLPDGSLIYWVDGDSGLTRVVTVGTDGLTICDCPSLINECAHITAVWDLHAPDRPDQGSLLGPDTPLSEVPTPRKPDRPVDDVPLPRAVSRAGPDHPRGEPLDEHGHTDDPEIVEATEVLKDAGLVDEEVKGWKRAHALSDEEDDELEVQVVGDAGPVPVVADQQRRDLIDISEAPVTWRTLEVIAKTDFVPAALRNKPAACLAAILTGRELGLGPMESLRMIAIIDGSPTLSAELSLKLYRQAGHTLEVKEASDTAVALVGTRGDTGEKLEVAYTIEDAERAGLVQITEDGEVRARSSKGRPMPWESFTPDLLWARAVTRLVRRLAPDLRGAA